MTSPTLRFGYPRRGLDGAFATFRLGARAAQSYPVDSVVELVDSRTMKLLKRAVVTSVDTGELAAMARLYGHLAHNWKEHPSEERPELLIASMKKRYKHYGPSRCSENSICSVICLKEIEDDNS